MPSTYAHRRFGADVLVQLPRELREKITPYRPLYDMGLHGPDLMFYYRALQSNPVNRLGNAMHEQPGRVFFTRARGVVNTARNKNAALAYALGFVCHFALDSTCHPYVERYTNSLLWSSYEYNIASWNLSKYNSILCTSCIHKHPLTNIHSYMTNVPKSTCLLIREEDKVSRLHFIKCYFLSSLRKSLCLISSCRCSSIRNINSSIKPCIIRK